MCIFKNKQKNKKRSLFANPNRDKERSLRVPARRTLSLSRDAQVLFGALFPKCQTNGRRRRRNSDTGAAAVT